MSIKTALSEADLSHFHCTENYWRHWSKRLAYTDGVKFVAERGGAYWLIDAVASHQTAPLVAGEEFQCWTLSRKAGRTFVLGATDGIHRTQVVLKAIGRK